MMTACAAGASHRARAVTGTMAQAEALAQLCRDHGHPARVIVGRKRGTLAIKVAEHSAYYEHGASGAITRTGNGWNVTRLPIDRTAVREWLGY
jgi:hypothetical protein